MESRITPDTKVVALAAHPLLDQLSGNELPVYLRLVAATRSQRAREVFVKNEDLFREPQTASRILRRLVAKKLIVIHLDGDVRSIEVL